MAETKVRSSIKSLIWRVCGVIILAAITYIYTQEWITTGLITFIHHAVFLFVFYFHERLWLKVHRVQKPVQRSLFKMLTYETLCGNVILGIITYTITGDWKQMTAITLTYIGFKHICYVFNEFIWNKIKAGKCIIMPLIFVLISAGAGFADYWTANAIKVGDFKLGTEIRMDSDVYLRLVQLDWNYKINDSFTMVFSEREIQTDKVEHSPMVSFIYRNGFITNRSRIQYRIRYGSNILRLRDKVTLTKHFYFTAFEVFIEDGKWYRNRYYVGINANKNLGFFLMKQTTGSRTILIFGANFTTEVLG